MRDKALLFVSSAGIFIAFNANAYFAERLTRARYEGKRFHFPSVQLLLNYLLVLLAATMGQLLKGERRNTLLRDKRVWAASAFSVLSLECAMSMGYRLSYLAQLLFRSSKFLSLTLSAFLFGGHASARELGLAAFSSLGLGLFLWGGKGESTAAAPVAGAALGVVSLVADCLVAKSQEGLRRRGGASFLALMQAMNLYNAFFSLGLALFKAEMSAAFAFATAHPAAARDQLFGALCFAAGSFFVFFHLQRFGPLSLAYVTSMRKVFTILASCLLFGYALDSFKKAGIAIIICGIAVELAENLRKSKVKKE